MPAIRKVVHGDSNPGTGIAGCCARAASGHAAAPPSAASNSRRPMVTVIRSSRARCVKGTIPRHERVVLTARQQHPHSWHFRAGGGAVHSINSGLIHCNKRSRDCDDLPQQKTAGRYEDGWPSPATIVGENKIGQTVDIVIFGRLAHSNRDKRIEGTMTEQLLERVAIVTGASNGIGRGIAEALAAAGAKTALAARRTEMLVEVASGIRNAGGTALPMTTDVTREDQVVQLFKKTYETYGRVDILVNNAGVPTHVPIEDITLKYWQEVLDVNLTAAFLCSREAIKIMKSQTPQGGRIINIGSVSAKTPRPDSLPYTATKFALQGMTHQLTMDGRKYGVVASILHPGATLSSFSTRRGRTKAGPGATPDDYVMAAEDVAKVVVLMCSLPPAVNLYQAIFLPNHMRSFIGRG